MPLPLDPPNARHRAIERWLIEFGLQPGMSVYEVGCGAGQVTSLIADVIDNGRLVAVDVDPERVEIAQTRMANNSNVTVLVADAVHFHPSGKFDVIVLPDVLEHIPGEHHAHLFHILSTHLSEEGFIFINMPNPLYLAWIHENLPQYLQQPVDEPVPTAALALSTARAGLVISHLQTYSVWEKEGDYQVVMLRHLAAASRFTG